MAICLFLFFMLFDSLHATTISVTLGDTTVVIQQKQYGKGKSFIHLHQNETTALKAAKLVVRSQGGSVLTLIHPGERNIVFHLHQQRYEFDPNRMFTDLGIKKTLRQYGAYSSTAHAEVKKLARRVKKLLPQSKIIAVHNNESYSLKYYLPGHCLASDAKAFHVNAQHPYRNFYLVTQKEAYLRLKKLKFNSIWQAVHAQDDGSLSVYMADRDYINVEAAYDQLYAQINMLKNA